MPQNSRAGALHSFTLALVAGLGATVLREPPAVLSMPATVQTHDSGPQMWRSQEGAVANAVYMLLGSFGVPRSYESIRARVESGDTTLHLARVVTLMRALGCRAEIQRLPVSAIQDAALPMIAYVEDGEHDFDGFGRLVVIATIDAQHKTLMFYDAITCLGREVPWGTFNREYHGMVVKCYGLQSSPWWRALAVALGGIVGSALRARWSRPC